MNNPLDLWQAQVPMTPRVYAAIKKDSQKYANGLSEERRLTWEKKMRRLEYVYKRFTSKENESKSEVK